MSGDIPDWLRGLAPDGEEDEDISIAPTLIQEEPEEEPVNLMDDLRNQIEGSATLPPTAAELARPTAKRRAKTTGGLAFNLRPDQQFILSVLLFLDVVIIGLLFLVMLGRIAIPAL
ncbi:MAG TPA: hypothetical protein PKH77_16050 [Anaerolineae bacterium]|nr:hypothetical protein [Anaerolineae bacterium]